MEMADRYPTPAENISLEHATQLPENPASRLAQIIDFGSYLEQRNEHLKWQGTLQRMSRAALFVPTTEHTLSIQVIYVDKHSNGDTTECFAAYKPDAPKNDYGMYHSNGWSGGTEHISYISVHHNAETDDITAADLHPRNLRHLESDIRAKKRTAGFEQELQEADAALRLAEDKLRSDKERVAAADSQVAAIEYEFNAMKDRLDSALFEQSAAHSALTI